MQMTQPGGQLWNQAMQVMSPDDQIFNQFGTNQNAYSNEIQIWFQEIYKFEIEKYNNISVEI